MPAKLTRDPKLHLQYPGFEAYFSSVPFSCSVMSDSLRPHGLQHTRLHCLSPTRRVYSDFWSIESVMPSNHLILCHPLLLSPSIFPSIRVFSSESVLHIRWTKYWSFSFRISPSNEYSGLISFRIDWFDLLAVHGTLKSHQGSRTLFIIPNSVWGFPGGSVSKEYTCNVGDLGSIPGLRRSPGGEDGNPLQRSCLENPHGQRSLAGCSPWGCKKSDMTEQLTQHILFYKWDDSSPGDNESRMPPTATSLTHSLFPTRNISFKTISAYLF